MEWAEGLTAANDRITLFVAFNYGGRAEIIDAARSFDGETEEDFRRHLYAPEMHDPDLIIRTSGEQRLSNYLLWQRAYAELVFRDELWPDFSREAFEGSLAEYERAPAPVRRAADGDANAPPAPGYAREHAIAAAPPPQRRRVGSVAPASWRRSRRSSSRS